MRPSHNVDRSYLVALPHSVEEEQRTHAVADAEEEHSGWMRRGSMLIGIALPVGIALAAVALGLIALVLK